MPSSDSTSAPPELAEARICTKKTCHRKLAPDSRYKTCDRCRASGRRQQKRAKDKKRQERLVASMLELSSDDTIPTQDEENLPIEERLKGWMGKLRDAGKLPLALRENGQDDYVDEIDGKRKALGDSGPEAKKRKVEIVTGHEEYQSQANLCRALDRYMRRLQSITSIGDFAASFTVVAQQEEMTQEKVSKAAKGIIREAKLPVWCVIGIQCSRVLC